MKTCITIPFILLMFISKMTTAQPPSGFYEFESNSKLYFSSDTLAVIFPNKDAFGTHSIFFGEYSVENNKIILKKNIAAQTFSILREDSTDGTDGFHLTFFDKSRNHLLQYSQVRIWIE